MFEAKNKRGDQKQNEVKIKDRISNSHYMAILKETSHDNITNIIKWY